MRITSGRDEGKRGKIYGLGAFASLELIDHDGNATGKTVSVPYSMLERDA